jgi:hypothetical protein
MKKYLFTITFSLLALLTFANDPIKSKDDKPEKQQVLLQINGCSGVTINPLQNKITVTCSGNSTVCVQVFNNGSNVVARVYRDNCEAAPAWFQDFNVGRYAAIEDETGTTKFEADLID